MVGAERRFIFFGHVALSFHLVVSSLCRNASDDTGKTAHLDAGRISGVRRAREASKHAAFKPEPELRTGKTEREDYAQLDPAIQIWTEKGIDNHLPDSFAVLCIGGTFCPFALMSSQAMSRMEWLLNGLIDGTKL
jgi:hypothetical protein